FSLIASHSHKKKPSDLLLLAETDRMACVEPLWKGMRVPLLYTISLPEGGSLSQRKEQKVFTKHTKPFACLFVLILLSALAFDSHFAPAAYCQSWSSRATED